MTSTFGTNMRLEENYERAVFSRGESESKSEGDS
jgi:hypothetical protein